MIKPVESCILVSMTSINVIPNICCHSSEAIQSCYEMGPRRIDKEIIGAASGGEKVSQRSMEWPDWPIIICGHNDYGLNTLQGKDYISSFNLKKACEVGDGKLFYNGKDGSNDSVKVGAA